mmetsp:Transcript_33364/g.92097  ORF Transcript_33364/g.92097 Transcript_33364/m.92097 type:complete len:518 (-) Transcript_33364:66-1619(-)
MGASAGGEAAQPISPPIGISAQRGSPSSGANFPSAGASRTLLKEPFWEVAWCPKNEKWFYQDRGRGVSSWKRPDGCMLQLPKHVPDTSRFAASPPEAPPPGWETAMDEKNRQHYYYNRSSGERTWCHPAMRSRTTASAPAAAFSAPFATNGGVGPGEQWHRDPVQAGGFKAAPAPDGGTDHLGEATRQGDTFAPTADTRAAGYQATRATAVVPDATSRWDPQAFRKVLERSRNSRNWHAVKAALRQVSESNYVLRDLWPVPATLPVQHRRCAALRLPSGGAAPRVTFSRMSTADALLHFSLDRRRRPGSNICALNFANGSQVGGGYKNGASAQEEDLCRRIPGLYTSLNNAKRRGFYPFGPCTCKNASDPGRYSDVLWTPNIVLARAGEETGFAFLPEAEQVEVCLVAAAAPNLKFARPPELCDKELMYRTVKSIFLAPFAMEHDVSTLILGAWGCGAFGGDPAMISDLFCRALVEDRLGHLYSEVHFAIPQFSPQDKNRDAFRATLKGRGISFRDL